MLVVGVLGGGSRRFGFFLFSGRANMRRGPYLTGDVDIGQVVAGGTG